MNATISRIAALSGAVAVAMGCTANAAPGTSQPHGNASFQFALIGDTPYGSTEKFENLLADINANNNIGFVLHAGDIKNGSSLCSDELFMDRFERFQRFDAPFILTPGDNEWTDCHRVGAGQYEPLERLAKLRELFYPVPGQALGQRPMTVESQGGEFVENVRWTTHNVTFATLHIVGSNNGLAEFDPNGSVIRTAADDEEVARRIDAAVQWIEQTYAQASANGDKGVLFLFQANPGFEEAPGSADREGFEEVISTMVEGAKQFGKPVILAHGDSHYFRIDKPVREGGAAIDNVTRVETFGSGDYHWLRVTVDPNSPQVFHFEQEIVEGN